MLISIPSTFLWEVAEVLRYTLYMWRMRHQNPDKSNNFSIQNFINEKIEYYKKFFYIS